MTMSSVLSSTIEPRRRELLVPGESRALGAVRWVVSQLAHSAGLPETAVHEIEVAVDEACANIVEHAYGHLERKPPIHLEFDISEEHFAVRILDRGHAFDLSSAGLNRFPEHYLEGHERGAGIFLIHSCADEVSYERLPDQRNCTRLVKNIVRSPSSTAS